MTWWTHPATFAGLQQAAASSGGMVVGGNVGGHRALMPDGSGRVVHADPSSTRYAFVGISLQASAVGASVQVAESGAQVTEPTWSWTSGAALFAGPDGTLTQTPPTTGACQQIAVAITSTSILVQPGPAIGRV